MPTYKTPDVYLEEISTLPSSVAEVESAIPAFVGYTEKANFNGENLLNKPTEIVSLLEYNERFGSGNNVDITQIDLDGEECVTKITTSTKYFLYDSMRLFFANGGGKCVIVSVGNYKDEIEKAKLSNGLTALEKEDDPTMLVFPDAINLDGNGLYDLQQQALAQCRKLMDRVVIMDLKEGENESDWNAGIDEFRNNIGMSYLMYGAAYTPHVITSLEKDITYRDIKGLIKKEDAEVKLIDLLPDLQKEPLQKLEAAIAEEAGAEDTDKKDEAKKRVKVLENALKERVPLYKNILNKVIQHLQTIPPSGIMAGVYSRVDNDRGVWKAPANVSISQALGVTQIIDNQKQESLNIDVDAGKSINAIRPFTGKGTMVWGARTLAGNDNEWRYVSVRRFFNVVEESIKKSTYWAVFEPNDANLWVKIKAMIENYLKQKWQEGGLVGATPDQAYTVTVGLGSTMTQQDILEGRLIVNIGLAVVRPAEFIIMKFMHKMQES